MTNDQLTNDVEDQDYAAEARESLVIRCEYSGCNHGPSYTRGVIPLAKTGRPGRFCTPACKQADYRDRKAIADREAARIEAALMMSAAWNRLVNDIMIELADVKMPTTVRKSTAERIARRISERRLS